MASISIGQRWPSATRDAAHVHLCDPPPIQQQGLLRSLITKTPTIDVWACVCGTTFRMVESPTRGRFWKRESLTDRFWRQHRYKGGWRLYDS